MGHGMGGSARGMTVVMRACLVAVMLGGAVPARAESDVLKVIVLPPGRTLDVAAGAVRRFSATVAETDVEYRWTVDGATVGTDWAFEYAPQSGDIGPHEVTVTVLRGAVATRHAWRVTVAPPPVPRIMDVSPSAAVVRSEPSAKVRFRYVVTSSVASDEIEVTWTVDGTRLGSGPVMDVQAKAERGAAQRVRAVAKSSLGVVQAREWRLVTGEATAAPVPVPEAVAPDPELTALVRSMKPERGAPTTTAPAPRPTTTSTLRAASTTSSTRMETTTSTRFETTTSSVAVVRATTTSTRPPARATTTSTRPPARATTTSTVVVARVVTTTNPPPVAPPTTVVVARLPPPTLPPPVAPAVSAGIARDEVVAFLERYADAYEARNVADLRRIGQITSAEQAEALGRYFEQVKDLTVDVTVIGIESRGDRAMVRYRRRDRFRDPTGRLVNKETPPIEKEIRRTPNGLVFSPTS